MEAQGESRYPQTVLVPLDGSILAELALNFAESLARASEARLILLRAVVPYTFGGTDEAEARAKAIDEAERYLARLVDRLAQRGDRSGGNGPLRRRRAVDRPARLRAVDLVAMSTHGRGGLGRWVYGSVAEQVQLATAPTAVLRACLAGARVGQPPSDRAFLYHSTAVDLVAMSTHGRGGLGRWVYGSVAEQVLATAPTAVLLVRAWQALESVTPATERRSRRRRAETPSLYRSTDRRWRRRCRSPNSWSLTQELDAVASYLAEELETSESAARQYLQERGGQAGSVVVVRRRCTGWYTGVSDRRHSRWIPGGVPASLSRWRRTFGHRAPDDGKRRKRRSPPRRRRILGDGVPRRWKGRAPDEPIPYHVASYAAAFICRWAAAMDDLTGNSELPDVIRCGPQPAHYALAQQRVPPAE